jgi:hypothetical protein
MFNAVLLDMLQKNKGKLPIDVDSDEDIIRHCFTNNLKNPFVQDVFEKYKDKFGAMVPERLKGDGNAITYASNQYKTNFKTHIKENVETRIEQLLKGFVNHHKIKLAKGQRWLALQRIQGLSSKAFDDKTPIEFIKFADKCSNAFKQVVDTNTKIEFLYKVMIYTKRYGGKPFSIAPLTGIRRQFVTIDKAVVWDYFYNNRFKAAGIVSKTMTKKDFESIDFQDHMFTIFKSKISKYKNVNNGWTFTNVVTTDGYGLAARFINLRQPKNKDSGASDMVYQRKENDYVVAFDPGVTNILYGVSDDNKTYKLTQYQYYKDGGIYASKKMHERWNLKVKDVLEQLSNTTYKTHLLQTFMEYVGVCAANHVALWDSLGHKKRNRNRMSTYIKKTKVLDKFFHSVKSPDITKRTVIAYGAARFNCCFKGRAASPTVATYKLCKKHFPTYLVDEYNTSKMCPCCDTELFTPYHYVTKTMEDGKQQKQRRETRGVKWCKSTMCLGSRGFSAADGVVCVRYIRDLVGALNIMRCFGKTNEERPACLQRQSKQ